MFQIRRGDKIEGEDMEEEVEDMEEKEVNMEEDQR